MTSGRPLRVATRRSALALAQTALITDRLNKSGHGPCEIVAITTRGDLVQDKSLSAIGGDGVFVIELYAALRDGRADIAVHSMKDLPVELPPDVDYGIVPERADARDVLLAMNSRHHSLQSLPPRAVVGTSSLRRQSQVRAIRPDAQVQDLRGNVDTRLRKLRAGEYDAIVVALAGVERIGLLTAVPAACVLDPAEMVPAVGQGALFVQCRRDDDRVRQIIAPLADSRAQRAVTMERAFLRAMSGGCVVPVGCHIKLDERVWRLHAFAGACDGSRVIRRALEGSHCDDAEMLHRIEALTAEMLDAGGREFIAQARRFAHR